MKTFTKYYFLLIFFGLFPFFRAQESKEILELKAKLLTIKSQNEQAKTLDEIGIKYYEEKKLDSAIFYSKKALPIFEISNNTEQIGKSNFLLGSIFLQKNDFINGEKHLLVAEKYLDKTDNYDKRAYLYYLLATVNSVYKRNDVASNYTNKIFELYKQGKIKDKKIVMAAYQSMFRNNFVQENSVEGYKSLNKYLDFTKNNFPEHLYDAYFFAGTFYINNKDFNKALDYFQKGLMVAKNNKNDFQIANCNMFIGNCYSEMNQFQNAFPYLNSAKNYFEKNKLNDNLKLIYYYLSDIYSKQKEYNKAEEYIDKTMQLTNEQDPMYAYFANQKGMIDLKKLLNEDIDFKNNPTKFSELQNLASQQTKSLEYFSNLKTFVPAEMFIQNYDILQQSYGKLGDYEKSYDYLKKLNEKREGTYGLEKMRSLSNVQSETELALQKAKIELQEQTKRIQLQKEIELKALKFEYEKKQAAAKTEEERKRLLLEEDLKRREIEITYAQQKKASEQKYIQEKKLAKINQEKKDAVAKAELENSKTQKNMWAIGAGLSLLLLGFAGFSYFQKQKDNKKIAEEKQKSDELLLNILPHEVAEELKEKGKTSAKHYDEVSVLFTDFVNFTSNSEKLGVQEVLNELNICFTEFDKIIEKNGLEKIKTIGDAYLAVSGLPVSNEKHAENAVNAGLEILDFIQKRRTSNPNALDIRIGIHSGPVIAGIVGVKKFAYDIWGDTVNTAARMEQNSQKGKLNISGSTYSLVKNSFQCEHRGKIEVKGKGALEMYFVNNASKF